MMGDELWIDGQKADMGEQSGVWLTYKSNLLSDVSKVTGSWSNTISLPVTGRNIALIGGSIHPGTTGGWSERKHKAVIRRNGIEIVSGGVLTLTGVSEDRIDVAVTWGVSEAMKELLTGDKLLGDLDLDYWLDGPITWMASGRYDTPMGWYGQRDDDDSIAAHPVVSVSELLTTIERDLGVQLRWDKEPWRSNDWVMPLLQRNAKRVDGKTWPVSVKEHNPEWGLSGYLEMNGGEICRWLTMWFDEHETVENNYIAYETYHIGGNDWGTSYGLPLRKGVKMILTGEIDAVVTTNVANNAYACTLAVVTRIWGNYNVLMEMKPTSVSSLGNNDYRLHFSMNGEESDAMTLDVSGWHDGGMVNVGVKGIIDWHSVAISGQLRVDYTQDRVYLRGAKPNPGNSLLWESATYEWFRLLYNRSRGEMGEFPIAKNMPKMKVLDFVKNLGLMTGQFAMVDNTGTGLRFTSFDTLYGNDAVDWSAYLIERRGWLPGGMEFRVDDEAQRNNVTYKDGDFEDGGAMDSWYSVDNETLPESRDAIQLGFCKYSMVGSYASVPIYSYEYKEEDVKDAEGEDTGEKRMMIDKVSVKKTDKPYIMVRKVRSGRYWLTNDGLTWRELLRDHYPNYVKMLNGARVMTERFVLSDVVLNRLDLTKRVWLRQYGAHFGIIEIKTKANNVAEVKLVKLPEV